jgi:HK97 gp10 family phage protein
MAIERIKIEGIEELTREIMNLSDDKIKRRELLKILRRQAKPLLASIKSKAPIADKDITIRGGTVNGVKMPDKTYERGNLQKSFKIQTGKSKAYPNVAVGPTRGSKAKNDGWYVHFLLYGTPNIQGNDFVKKGADATLPIINNSLSAELQRYVTKKTKQIPFIK